MKKLFVVMASTMLAIGINAQTAKPTKDTSKTKATASPSHPAAKPKSTTKSGSTSTTAKPKNQ